MRIFKFFRYLFETIIIILFFVIFKIIGLKNSSFISGKIFTFFGPFFRSEKIITQNLKTSFPNVTDEKLNEYKKDMWNYYGKIFAEYIFLKKLRKNEFENVEIFGNQILDRIKDNKEPVIFVSGHFDNFELMAMYLEKSGINLSTVYRPLNNFFMNKIMEKLRLKYICKNQIKKGRPGLKDSLRLFKAGYSIALMIDQRVSEGEKVNFFEKKAYTTTIPAQFVKKFGCKVVPINIKRIGNVKFTIKIFEPVEFSKNASISQITHQLNIWLEKEIIKNPSKWIWSHNRWK